VKLHNVILYIYAYVCSVFMCLTAPPKQIWVSFLVIYLFLMSITDLVLRLRMRGAIPPLPIRLNDLVLT
jgi:hypothetical protein